MQWAMRPVTDEKHFSLTQWGLKREYVCKGWIQIKTSNKDVWKCGRCTLSKPRSEYSEQQRIAPSYIKKNIKRRCNSCMERLQQDERDALAGNFHQTIGYGKE